jgi:hypothetical protein
MLNFCPFSLCRKQQMRLKSLQNTATCETVIENVDQTLDSTINENIEKNAIMEPCDVDVPNDNFTTNSHRLNYFKKR